MLRSILEAREVFKSYRRVRALNGLNLRISGGVVGLIGPNGAGKTTAIKIFLGLLRANRGSVKVFGLDPWRNGFEVRRRVGVLHERPVYPGDITGRLFLKYIASFYGVKDVDARVREVLKLVGLEFVAHRPIKEYSAGMVQRLGFAKAIIGNPELVILDEPTANLDPAGRAEILDLIAMLSKDEGVSFLISTHILSELERVCKKVFIIYRGRIIAEGSLKDMVERYRLTEYTVELTEPSKLAEKLEELEHVKVLDVDEARGRLYLSVADPDSFRKTLFKLALELDLKIISFKPRYGILEQVYRRVLSD